MRLRLVALFVVPVALALPDPAGAVTNPQVPGLQVALRAKGFYRGPIDGIAGPMTARAVRAFQRRAGIVVDAGVKIIFNYTEALLHVPPDVTVHTTSPAVELLYALYFYLT